MWSTFKYKNSSTFFFICGLLGHSEKYCARFFDTPESKIVKPYVVWIRTPLKRHTKLIDKKWLRDSREQPDTMSTEKKS